MSNIRQARLVKGLGYSAVLASVGLLLSVIIPSVWLIIPLTMLRLTLVGGFIVRSGLSRRDPAELIFGLLILLTSCVLPLVVLESHLPEPLSDLSISVAIVFAGVVGTCLLVLSLGRSYLSTAFAWRIRGERGLRQLIRILERGSLLVPPYQAARIIGEIGDERAVEALIGALSQHASWVLTEAARALGKIGDALALPALQRMAVEDTEPDVYGTPARDVAGEAIRCIRSGK